MLDQNCVLNQVIEIVEKIEQKRKIVSIIGQAGQNLKTINDYKITLENESSSLFKII